MGFRSALAQELKNFFSFLEPKERKSFWAIVLGSAIVGLSESFMILFVKAFIDLVFFHNGAFVDYNPLQIPTDNLPLFVFLFLTTFIMAKTAYAFFMQKQTYTLVGVKQAELSAQLMKRLLQKSYSFFLENNSSVLTQHIIHEVSTYANAIFRNAMLIIADFFIFLAIFFLLLIVDVQKTLVLCSIGAMISVLFYWGIQQRIGGLGKQAMEMRDSLQKQANDIMSSAKDIKINGNIDNFVKKFLEQHLAFADVNARYYTINNSVTIFMGFIVFFMIAVFLLLLHYTNYAATGDITELSIFVLGAYRLMPPLNRMLGNITHVKFSMPIYRMLLKTVDTIERTPTSTLKPLAVPPEFNEDWRAITFNNINFSYDNVKMPALNGIDVSLERGRCYGIAGVSGAGKTTFIDLIVALHQQTKGTIDIDGEEMGHVTYKRFCRQHLAYVPQHISLFDGTIRDNLIFSNTDLVSEQEFEDILAVCELQDIIQSLPQGLDTPVGDRGVRLSGGQRQRLGLARGLLKKPQVLVIDEGTSALDAITEQEFIQKLHAYCNKRVTIVMIAHRLATLDECDEILLFKSGEIIERGSYADLLKNSAYFRQLGQIV
jgi:ABC-type multidrug transport system fused ATPase/permease subunit